MPEGPAEKTPAAREAGARPWRLLAGLIAVAAIIVLGSAVFFTAPTALTLGPVAGIAAALAARRPAEAAALAGLGTLLGVAIAALLTTLPWRAAPDWTQVAGALLVAALVAAGGRWAIDRRARLAGVLTAAALAIVIASSWYAAASAAVRPVSADGSTLVSLLASRPRFGPDTMDEHLFLVVIDRVAAGEGYYRAVVLSTAEANRARVAQENLANPLSYRLPTMPWLLSRLPRDGWSLLFVGLACGAVASMGAFALARRFVPAEAALVAATAVAAYYAGVAVTAELLQVEPWAGALGLVSAALFAWSQAHERRRAVLAWSAAAAALAAATVRETAVAFLLLGLIATLADADLRRRRLWVPWLGGLAVALAVYAGHWTAIGAVVRELGLPASTAPNPWLHPDGLGLLAAAARVGGFLAAATALGWALVGLGLAGVLAAVRDRGTRVFLLGFTVAAPLALAFLHPTGYNQQGLPPSYWSDLALPTILACVPLTLAFVPGMREASAEEPKAKEPAAPPAAEPG